MGASSVRSGGCSCVAHPGEHASVEPQYAHQVGDEPVVAKELVDRRAAILTELEQINDELQEPTAAVKAREGMFMQLEEPTAIVEAREGPLVQTDVDIGLSNTENVDPQVANALLSSTAGPGQLTAKHDADETSHCPGPAADNVPPGDSSDKSVPTKKPKPKPKSGKGQPRSKEIMASKVVTGAPAGKGQKAGPTRVNVPAREASKEKVFELDPSQVGQILEMPIIHEVLKMIAGNPVMMEEMVLQNPSMQDQMFKHPELVQDMRKAFLDPSELQSVFKQANASGCFSETGKTSVAVKKKLDLNVVEAAADNMKHYLDGQTGGKLGNEETSGACCEIPPELLAHMKNMCRDGKFPGMEGGGGCCPGKCPGASEGPSAPGTKCPSKCPGDAVAVDLTAEQRAKIEKIQNQAKMMKEMQECNQQ